MRLPWAEVEGVAEFLALAQRSYEMQRFELAATFWKQALEADPTRAESRQTQHPYNAACAAALAGCGEGVDDPPPNDESKARLRAQALEWLQSELETWKQQLENASAEQRRFVVGTLHHWQADPDLSGVRGDAIDKLPESERADWNALWQSVREILQAEETVE